MGLSTGPRCPNLPNRYSGGIRPMLLVLSKYAFGAGVYPSIFRLYRSIKMPPTTNKKVAPRAHASAMSTTKPIAMCRAEMRLACHSSPEDSA